MPLSTTTTSLVVDAAAVTKSALHVFAVAQLAPLRPGMQSQQSDVRQVPVVHEIEPGFAFGLKLPVHPAKVEHFGVAWTHTGKVYTGVAVFASVLHFSSEHMLVDCIVHVDATP